MILYIQQRLGRCESRIKKKITVLHGEQQQTGANLLGCSEAVSHSLKGTKYSYVPLLRWSCFSFWKSYTLKILKTLF